MKKALIAAAVLLVVVGAAAAYWAYDRGLIGSAGAAAQVLPLHSGELSANQLAIGTLMLEDTDQAVTQEQATKLLPLWQMLQSLYGSNSVAQEEVDAVVKQLRQAMTDVQLETIRATGSEPQDMAQVMESLGIDRQLPQVDGTPAAGQSWSGMQIPQGGDVPQVGGVGGGGMPQGGGTGGGMAQGGGPQGGDDFGGGMNFSEGDFAQARATRQASGETGGPMMGQTNTMMIEAVIELLQERATGAAD